MPSDNGVSSPQGVRVTMTFSHSPCARTVVSAVLLSLLLLPTSEALGVNECKSGGTTTFPSNKADTLNCASAAACMGCKANCDPGQDCTVLCQAGNSCTNMVVTCPDNRDCTVNCNEQLACQDMTVKCPIGGACNVLCLTPNSCTRLKVNQRNAAATGNVKVTCQGSGACGQLDLDCSATGTCKLVCQTGACTAMDVEGGSSGSLEIVCDSQGCTGGAATRCPGSGTCKVVCNGAQSCQGLTVSAQLPGTGTLDMRCDTLACQDLQVICPEKATCATHCYAENACVNARVDCPVSANCDVSCSKTASCQALKITHNRGHTGGTTGLDCHATNACLQSSLHCGTGAGSCTQTCTASKACAPSTFKCPSKDSNCQLKCSVASSCTGGAVECPAIQAPTPTCAVTCNGATSCTPFTVIGRPSPVTCQPLNVCDTPLRNFVGITPVPPTDAPPTDAPPTDAPPTDAPPTDAPPTDAPPTDAPPTDAPPTDAPPTDAPPTDAPPTDAPPTDAPPTDAPPTDAPPTDAPPTDAPPTDAPPTNAPPTDAPPTDAPPTDAPPTNAPPTDAPPTDTPRTDAPLTDVPPTNAPPTNVPGIKATDSPTTNAPPTEAPPTGVPSTATPSTVVPGSTPAPDTSVPSTTAPMALMTLTPETDSPGNSTPAPALSASTAPSTVAPVVGAPNANELMEKGFPMHNSGNVKHTVSVASVGAFSGTGMGGRLAILKNFGCEVDDVDLAESEPLDFEFHPTGVTIGDSKRKYMIGAMVMNPVILLSMLVLLSVVALAFSRLMFVPINQAFGNARAPGMCFIPYLFLLQGSSLVGARMTFYPGDAHPLVTCSGCLLLLLCCTSPFLLYWKLLRKVREEAYQILDPALYPRPDLKTTRVYTGVVGSVYRFVYGDRVWTSKYPDDFFVEKYGVCFESYKESREWFSTVELTSMNVLSILSAWRPKHNGECDARNTLVCLLFLVLLLLQLYYRPYTATLDNAISSILTTLMLGACVLMTIGLWVGVATTSWLYAIARTLLLLSAILVIVKCAWDLLTYTADIVLGRKIGARKVAIEEGRLAMEEEAYELCDKAVTEDTVSLSHTRTTGLAEPLLGESSEDKNGNIIITCVQLQSDVISVGRVSV